MPADETSPPDAIDRRIAGLLATNGRMSVADVAQAVSLSRSATSERIRRLERDGWIVGYRAELDPAFAGRALEAVVDVVMRPHADRSEVEAWFGRQPTVIDAVHLTGAHDYSIRVRCRDPEELDVLVTAMKKEAEVTSTQTRVVLRRLSVAPDLVGVRSL